MVEQSLDQAIQTITPAQQIEHNMQSVISTMPSGERSLVQNNLLLIKQAVNDLDHAGDNEYAKVATKAIDEAVREDALLTSDPRNKSVAGIDIRWIMKALLFRSLQTSGQQAIDKSKLKINIDKLSIPKGMTPEQAGLASIGTTHKERALTISQNLLRNPSIY